MAIEFNAGSIEPALRKSPFLGVPPFINFVPGGGFPGKNISILTYIYTHRPRTLR